MRYPEFLKQGDTIGICAPSCGIEADDLNKIKRYEEAKKQLVELGYKVIDTDHIIGNERGRSASAQIRAEEFMSLLENDEVKAIIFAGGGDYLCEMLDYLDFDKISTLKPKWLQGYSDITGVGYLFNTILDIPTMYSQNIRDYAMRPLHKSLTDALDIMSGKNVIQESFELYENDWPVPVEGEEKEEVEYDPCQGYDLGQKVEWKNITGQEVIEFSGRTIGGCLDAIISFVGTKYDKVGEYLEKHKEDGFIWFFDCFELGSAMLLRSLWQLKNAGYFKYCNGIVFGRPLFTRDDYDITFNESILESLGDLNIPIIADADVGHRSPQMAIINGAKLKFRSENGKGVVETYFD